MRNLLIERLPIAYAAAEEVRPAWHDRKRIRSFRQQRPQRRMVPAELMAGAVTVLANTLPESLHLGDELLT